MVAGLLLCVLTAASCGSSSAIAASAPDGSIRGNPLVTVERQTEEVDRPTTVDSCLTVKLQVDDIVRSNGFLGRLVLENGCRFDVAILLSPVEVRVRESGGKALLNEHMVHAAYSRLYFISADSDFDQAFSEIDGGLSVYGAPSYIRVPMASVQEIPFRGGPSTIAGVRSGKYLVIFETLAALVDATDEPVSHNSVNLENSVAVHNESARGEPRVFLRSGTHWISSSGPVVSVRD